MIYEQNQNISKEIIKKNQIKTWELKNTITKLKNLPEGFNSRFQQVEKRFSKLEDR